MTLTKSHVAGPVTPAVREMTFGDLLRKAAEAAPDRLALIAGVPDPKLRRHGRHDPRHREPGLSRPGSRICAEAVALGRRLRRQRLSRQPNARDGAGGGAE